MSRGRAAHGFDATSHGLAHLLRIATLVRVLWCLPILLLTSNAWALTVTGVELSLDGALLTSEDLDGLVNAARCTCEEKVDATYTFSGLGSGGAVVIMAGTRCIDSDERLDDSCTELWSDRVQNVSSFESLTFSMKELAGGSCSGTEATRSLFVLVDTNDEDRWQVLHETAFSIDTEAPEAPTGTEVVAGEGLAEVVFEAPDDAPTTTQYQVLCDASGEAVFTSPEDAVFDSAADRCEESGPREAFVCAESQQGSASVTVLGLENGTEYTFYVVSVDDAGNPSAIETVGKATPSPEEDLWERYKRSGGIADPGHCFVATAAYGDYDDPTVRWFRVFRDTRLAKSSFGRDVIDTYYATSPPAARRIADDPLLRAAAREVLARVRDFAVATMFAGGAR